MKALEILRKLDKQMLNFTSFEVKEALEELTTLQLKVTAYEMILAESDNELQALKLKNSNLHKLLDQATYSLRCEELKVAELKEQVELWKKNFIEG